MALKEGPKVKSEHIRRFPAHDFLYVGFTLHTSKTNNKRLISTFKFGYPRLTLKEGFKVKSDHIRRFPTHDFLSVDFTLQTSRTNNKGDICTFKVRYVGYFGTPWMTLNKSFKVKCLQGCRHVYLLYISAMKRFNLLPTRTSGWTIRRVLD